MYLCFNIKYISNVRTTLPCTHVKNSNSWCLNGKETESASPTNRIMKSKQMTYSVFVFSVQCSLNPIHHAVTFSVADINVNTSTITRNSMHCQGFVFLCLIPQFIWNVTLLMHPFLYALSNLTNVMKGQFLIGIENYESCAWTHVDSHTLITRCRIKKQL